MRNISACASFSSSCHGSPSAESRPRTFSMTTQSGRSPSMAFRYSDQRPERVPSRIPARRPARETSWHGYGKPPVRTETGASLATSFQSTFVTSPKFGVSGK